MRAQGRAVLLTGELVAGAVCGFVSTMILDRSRQGAAERDAALSWKQEAARAAAAGPEGVVHGTQAGTADSRLSR
jgi:hypothetical protein